MAKCCLCGKRFNLAEARDNYDYHYNFEFSYNEDYPDGDVCLDCAVCETNSNIDAYSEIPFE